MNKTKHKKHVEKKDPAVEKTNPLTELVGEVVGKNNADKMVNKALEKTGLKSETVSDTVELSKKIQSDTEKSWVGKLTTAALGGLALLTGKEVFSKKETKNIGKTADVAMETWNDEDKMKQINTDIKEVQKLKETHADSFQSVNPNMTRDEALKKAESRLDELEDKYAGKEKNQWDAVKNAWSATATNEEGENRSWFGRAFAFFPAMFKEFGKFKLAKKLESEDYFNKKRRIKTQALDIKGKANEVIADGKKVGKKAGEKVSQAKKLRDAAKRSGTLPALKLLKQNNAIGSKYVAQAESLIKQLEKGKISPTEFAKNISENYRKAIGKLTEDLQHGRIKPQKFADVSEAVLKDTQTLAGKNAKTQEAFLKLVKEKKVPGMKLNKSIGKLSKIPVGAVGIASAINIALIDAIQAGEFSKFFDSITSKETLTEAFVPGVGTWHSIQRANNTDDPTWLKATDIGINVIGDFVLTAGYIGSIFSFGASGAGGITARSGLRVASRQLLKTARKTAWSATKKGARSSLFMSPFTVGLSLLAKKFKKKDVEKAATDLYIKEGTTDAQKEFLELMNKKKKKGKVVKMKKSENDPSNERKIETKKMEA